VDPSLRSRLERLNAEFAALDIEPDRAVWLACDLLLDGVDTPALCELAGESPTRLDKWETRDRLRQVLEELGIPPMSYEEADWFLGREAALRILDGAPRAEWADETWRITVKMAEDSDEVFAALANRDADPEPFRGFVREYLRLADEQLGRSHREP
jgi:hypothetical protein